MMEAGCWAGGISWGSLPYVVKTRRLYQFFYTYIYIYINIQIFKNLSLGKNWRCCLLRSAIENDNNACDTGLLLKPLDKTRFCLLFLLLRCPLLVAATNTQFPPRPQGSNFSSSRNQQPKLAADFFIQPPLSPHHQRPPPPPLMANSLSLSFQDDSYFTVIDDSWQVTCVTYIYVTHVTLWCSDMFSTHSRKCFSRSRKCFSCSRKRSAAEILLFLLLYSSFTPPLPPPLPPPPPPPPPPPFVTMTHTSLSFTYGHGISHMRRCHLHAVASSLS